MLLPLDGRRKGKERGAAEKQLGGGWSRWREMEQAGRHGVKLAVQPRTDPDGEIMSKPCVPPGTERIKVKVR